MFTVPWRSGSGRWGGPPRPWWNIPLKWPWVGAAAPRNGWSRPETAGCLSPRRQGKGQKVLPGRADEKVDGGAEGTHLKTAVYQADVRGGDVKMSLNLRDGTLHVCRRQRSWETGEGQDQNKHLHNRRKKTSHQNHPSSSPYVQKSYITDYKNKTFSFNLQLNVRLGDSAAAHRPISALLVKYLFLKKKKSY